MAMSRREMSLVYTSKCPVPFASLCFPDFPEDGSVGFQNTVHSVELVLSMVLNQDPGLLFFPKLIVI